MPIPFSHDRSRRFKGAAADKVRVPISSGVAARAIKSHGGE
jgi:hypothetical protein